MSRTITALPLRNSAAAQSADHHVGNPPTHFKNPWPSAAPIGLSKILETRFFRSADKTNLPVPADRKGLVPVQTPDWGASSHDKLRATWIGHASFLIETSSSSETGRGVRILLDPVFSERTSPVQWFGPKRYNPTPCSLAELPEIDILAVSHNHYDHLDTWTITEVYRISKERGRTPLVACALGNKAFFASLLPEMSDNDIIELDWWQGARIDIPNIGSVELTCTPAQHTSARSFNDKDKALWCSWIVQEANSPQSGKSVFFAGDTGYRRVTTANPTEEEEATMPHCPAFKEIGDTYGPFDLALLPIGLFLPRDVMSTVHCAPDDSACVHVDIKSKRSIGMHYGTVRGGLSAYYEDVLEPPRRWKAVCDKRGLKWGEEVGLCNIGETVLV